MASFPAFNQPNGQPNSFSQSNNNSPWFSANQTGGNLNMTGAMGSNSHTPPASGFEQEEDYDNEPPLLEELGINFSHIWTKTQSVLLPTKSVDEHILDDTDLAGPLVFCFVFGVFLLLSGKIHFGYIYGFGGLSCLFVYLILNLTSPERLIDIYRVCSTLGYGLLPIIALAAVNIFISIGKLGIVGFIMGILSILWSSYTATRFFESALHMYEQRYLIAYPVAVVYSCFALITVF